MARPAPPACRNSNEAKAIACSDSAARRVGDTLYIRLETGVDSAFTNETTGDARGGYFYVGRIGRPAFHLVQSYGHATHPSWILMNPRTGRVVADLDSPVLSPDSGRFAAAEVGWDDCGLGGVPRLEVWRFTDSIPVREWQLRPGDCRGDAAWGPTDPIWRGGDTLQFTRSEMPPEGTPVARSGKPAYVKRTMRAVRDGFFWRLLTPP